MTAFNAVRMRVKPGKVDEFMRLGQETGGDNLPGMRAFHVVKTGDRDFCIIGEWTGMDALAAARPEMIRSLDSFRDLLEDLGGGLGVTDPVSGETVYEVHH